MQKNPPQKQTKTANSVEGHKGDERPEACAIKKGKEKTVSSILRRKTEGGSYCHLQQQWEGGKKMESELL